MRRRISAFSCAFGAAAILLLAPDTVTAQTRTTTSPTTTEPTRTQPSVSPPAPTTTSTFLIPGGAGDILNTPLWLKFTKLIVGTATDDGSPSDEVYVLMTAVVLNWDKLWESQAFVSSTRVYEDLDYQDVRSLNYPVWGTESAPAIPIRSPHDVIVLLSGWEHDNGNVFIATQVVRAAVMTEIGKLHPGYTKAQISEKIRMAVAETLHNTVRVGGGDDPLGGITLVSYLPITADDLNAARNGTVVKKPFEYYDFEGGGSKGNYMLRFQLGKQGVSQVVW